MEKKRDYYEVLEVNKNATQDEIKKAFRKMAMKYHPDRNKEADAENRFKQINEAYEVLSNPDSRSIYDRYGHDGLNQGGFAHGNPFDIFNEVFGGGFGGFSGGSINIEDIFGDIFSGGGGRRQGFTTNTGSSINIQAKVTISLLESIKGTTKEISFDRQVHCSVCKGTGAKTENDLVTCTVCRGTGQVIEVKKTILGNMQTQSICLNCNGRGKRIKEKCPSCNGKTYNLEKQKVTIKIPAGIEHGDQLQVSGKGNVSEKATGNLHVKVLIQQSENFERVGLNIKGLIYLEPIRAIIGGEVEVVTPFGIEKINIKKDTKNGDMYRLHGKGITVSKKSGFVSNKTISGDFIGIVKIVDSNKLTNDEIKQLEKIAKKENKIVTNAHNAILKEIS